MEGVKFMERTCVSVIVPIYNTKPWLEECIRSILDQKFDQPFEVILVDDGATDGCGELCDQMAARDKRIRVIHQENQGLSAARNTGIDAAQGRYYAFVDSDDILRPTYLQTLYDACEKHDAYMSICAVEDVREDGSSAEPPAYTMPSETGVFSGKELLNRFYAPNGTYYTVAWNKLYRAEVWKLLHYPEGRLHEDDFVAHRLFWRCDKVVCLDAQLYCYRLRGGSICRTSIKPEAFDAVDGLADRYRFYVENGADRTVIDNAYAACWRRYLFLCAKVRQNPEPKLVKAISKILRSSIEINTVSIPLDAEIELLQSYLYIQKLHLKGRVTFCLDVRKSFMDEDVMIPPLTIQPLVENSIQHGLKDRVNGGKVDILITEKPDYIEAVVADNGVGFPEDPSQPARRDTPIPKTSIGLKNVEERLRLFYRKEDVLHIQRTEGITKITLKLYKSDRH